MRVRIASAAGRSSSSIELNPAAFDGMAFGPPTQHAAGKVGDVAKARFPQNDRGLRGAAAGAADGDDRTIARQFPGALGEVAERDQDRALNVPERTDELFGLAHVEDLNRRRVFLEPVRIDFPDPGKRISERRPTRLCGYPDAGFG